jgi:uncharacterized NAD(P)/FAD-binding protein YdhS
MTAVPVYQRYARRIIETEARNTGEPITHCIRSVARRLRVSHGSIWALLYRSPKDVRSRLAEALAEEVQRTLRGEIASLENELLAVRLGAIGRSPGEMEEIATDLARLKDRVQGARA